MNGVEVKPGQVVVLENARANKGETKDDEARAQDCGAADAHVNDARHGGTAPRHDARRHVLPRCGRRPLMAAGSTLGGLANPARPLVAMSRLEVPTSFRVEELVKVTA